MTAPRTARRIESARARVVETTWDLLQHHPWDAVTVAMICDAADIAPRTFHRYFPDKAEVLFSDAARHEQGLLDSMTRHDLDPAEPAGFLAAVLDDVAADIQRYGRAALATRQRVIRATPELAARDLLKRGRLLEIASAALTQRLGETDRVRARMLAGIALQACFVGMDVWVDDGGELREHIHEAMAAAGWSPDANA